MFYSQVFFFQVFVVVSCKTKVLSRILSSSWRCGELSISSLIFIFLIDQPRGGSQEVTCSELSVHCWAAVIICCWRGKKIKELQGNLNQSNNHKSLETTTTCDHQHVITIAAKPLCLFQSHVLTLWLYQSSFAQFTFFWLVAPHKQKVTGPSEIIMLCVMSKRFKSRKNRFHTDTNTCS